MSKFKLRDHVRVTAQNRFASDQVGDIMRVDATHDFPYVVEFAHHIKSRYKEHELTLADPDVHTVLDQMDAESGFVSVGTESNPITIRLTDHQAPGFRDTTEQEPDVEVKSEGAAERTGITANDKLRMIADTVEQQQPFGSELANFRRRLSAILSIGHDA